MTFKPQWTRPRWFPGGIYETLLVHASALFPEVTDIKSDNMNIVAIKLLLKPDKDPMLPSTYRPISLINKDIKIIAKVLATRLEKMVPSIIHNNHTGFIKGRHSNNNVRRILNLMSRIQRRNTEAIVLSLETFDKVNWSFLFAVLRKFGFG